MIRIAALACILVALALTGCGPQGKVEQGRVIAYDPQTRQVTLIPEAAAPPRSGPGVLPPVTIATPTDASEMGPAPKSGGLMLVDARNHRIVVYNGATQSFQTIQYKVVAERHNVARSAGVAVVDRAGKTITIYAAKEKALITFAASDELLAMPAATWRAGDVVRYYFKEPGQALRFMNVTATDLSKAVG